MSNYNKYYTTTPKTATEATATQNAEQKNYRRPEIRGEQYPEDKPMLSSSSFPKEFLENIISPKGRNTRVFYGEDTKFAPNFGKEQQKEEFADEDTGSDRTAITAQTEPEYDETEPAGFPVPETVESDLFIPGYLMTQIGKIMRVEFLIGTNLTDRNGRLVQVGASYITLRHQDGNLIVCDMFSIKFITIIENPQIILNK